MKERIKALRKALQLNQTAFGEKIGIKQGTVAGYENGSRQPIDAVISAICREWNVSEEWLRDGVGEMFVSADRRQQLHAWADRVLADSPESFRYRFVDALSRLPDEWWYLTEKAALEVLADYNPEQAAKFREESAAGADPEEASHSTYEVGTNFGAVGDGAVVIKKE